MTTLVGIRDSELEVLSSLDAADQVTILKPGPFRNRRIPVQHLIDYTAQPVIPVVTNHENRITALEQSGGPGEEELVYEYTVEVMSNCSTTPDIFRFPLALIEDFPLYDDGEPDSYAPAIGTLDFYLELHPVESTNSIHTMSARSLFSPNGSGGFRASTTILNSTIDPVDREAWPEGISSWVSYRESEPMPVQVLAGYPLAEGTYTVNGRVHYSGRVIEEQTSVCLQGVIFPGESTIELAPGQPLPSFLTDTALVYVHDKEDPYAEDATFIYETRFWYGGGSDNDLLELQWGEVIPPNAPSRIYVGQEGSGVQCIDLQINPNNCILASYYQGSTSILLAESHEGDTIPDWMGNGTYLMILDSEDTMVGSGSIFHPNEDYDYYRFELSESLGDSVPSGPSTLYFSNSYESQCLRLNFIAGS